MINFSDVSGVGEIDTETINVTQGLVTREGGFDLAGSGDTFYAYVGALDNPSATGFLAAVATDAAGFTDPADGVLTNTGLTEGVTAANFGAVADGIDGAEYIGVRSGQSAFSDYLAIINGAPLSDDFTVALTDGESLSPFDETMFTIIMNEAPVANDDSYGVDEDNTLTVVVANGVLANDIDADSDPLTAALVDDVTNGTLTLNADGSFTYTPNADFNGSDSFTYRANDGTEDSGLATVSITVNPVNDAPVAANDAFTTDEDTTLNIAAPGVLANDNDVDGDTLTSILVDDVANGTLSLNADGSFDYTPNANFNGADSFTYRANDGSVESDIVTVAITVNPVNDAPVANDDSYSTDEDNTLTVDVAGGVLSNDADVDGDALTAVLASDVSNGSLTLNADGSFDYTPDADFFGTDSFTYVANDGTLDSAPATVAITVDPVNDAPVVISGIGVAFVNESTDASPTGFERLVTFEDADVDDEHTVTVELNRVSAGERPDLTDAEIGALYTAGEVMQEAGSTTRTFDLAFSAESTVFDYLAVGETVTINYTITIDDGQGGVVVRNPNVVVTGTNDAPVAADDAATTDEDVAVNIDVLGNDSDVDGDALSVSQIVSGPSNGSVVIEADNTVTYTPTADFNGADSFTYEISDGNGGVDTATVSVTINPVNDAPVAMDDAATTGHCDPTTIDVLANDSDVDGDALSVVAFDDSATAGLVTDNGDGTFAYDPNGQFAFLGAGETATDTFTYTISDGELESTATVTVAIEGEDGVFNNGTGFTFQVGTNGGANRFTFDGDEFTIRGSDVGREAFQDVDSLLARSAELFDGVVERSGNINDEALAFGGGPNNINVNANDEVTIGGSGIGGSYRIQFENTSEAENFRDFVLQLFSEIDDNDAIAVDPEDFRFDADDVRVFYDKTNDEFGLTTDDGATQERFDTLEEFVEGIAAELGGAQQRDGNFNAQSIADGVTPSVGVFSTRVAIGGAGVSGQFRFNFGDRDSAQDAGDAFRELFASIDEANIVAAGDEPGGAGASVASIRAIEFDEDLMNQSSMTEGMFGLL